MRTQQVANLCLVLGLAVLLCCCGAVRAAGDGQGPEGGKHGEHRGERIGQMIDKMLERVTERIQRLQDRMGKHADAPAAVKTAAQKLLADLNTLKSDLTKAKEKAASGEKGDGSLREQIKKDHETVRADHEALRTAIETARQEHKDERGQKQRKEGKRA